MFQNDPLLNGFTLSRKSNGNQQRAIHSPDPFLCLPLPILSPVPFLLPTTTNFFKPSCDTIALVPTMDTSVQRRDIWKVLTVMEQIIEHLSLPLTRWHCLKVKHARLTIQTKSYNYIYLQCSQIVQLLWSATIPRYWQTQRFATPLKAQASCIPSNCSSITVPLIFVILSRSDLYFDATLVYRLLTIFSNILTLLKHLIVNDHLRF